MNMINHSELRLISALFGSDPLYVQGAGGNISLKDGATMWVKASGLYLGKALERDIFMPLPLAGVREYIRDRRESFIDLVPGIALRPSIEIPLHALLPQRIVMHLHMIDAIVHTLLPNAVEILSDCLDGLRWVYLPYVRPGLPLSLATASVLEQSIFIPELVMLENHGLIVAAETEASVLKLVQETAQRLFLTERSRPLPEIFALRDRNDLGWEIPLELTMHAIAFEPALSALSHNPVLYPDHVVFLGPFFPIACYQERLSEAIVRFTKDFGRTLPYAVFPGMGILLAPDITPGARAMLTALAQTVLRLPEEASPRCLNSESVAELDNWDAELWRRQLDRRTSDKHKGES